MSEALPKTTLVDVPLTEVFSCLRLFVIVFFSGLILFVSIWFLISERKLSFLPGDMTGVEGDFEKFV